jgi:hypothetical protein
MNIPKIPGTLVLSVIALAIFTASAHSQDEFTSSGSNAALPGNGTTVPDGTYYDYNDPANWSSGVPNLDDTTNSAVIGNGSNVGYYSAENGDLIISGGATLYITNGTFTQVDGGSYLDLGRNGGGFGNLVINGGVFNQGTVSSTPFNVEGVGNTFTISSGTANFTSTSVTLNVGLTYLQSGGTVNADPTGEFDVNSTTATISGGILNASLLTTVNATGPASLTFSGGTINLGSGAIYGGNEDQINFTSNSTGVINFSSTGTAAAEAFLTGGEISYDGTIDPSAFAVVADGADGSSVYLTIPEPSTYALFGLGGFGIFFILRRKRATSLS